MAPPYVRRSKRIKISKTITPRVVLPVDGTIGVIDKHTSIKNETTTSTTTTSTTPIGVIEQVLNDTFLLQYILSYVGNYQYRFIACVNHIFRTAYKALYPNKAITYINASTMDHMMICYNEVHYTMQHHIVESAAMYGNIDALQYLHNSQYLTLVLKETDSCDRVCEKIIANGHIHILQWAKMNHIEMNMFRLSNLAAKYGNLTILQWLNNTTIDDKKCKWDTRTCAYAALGGQLSILQWSREHQCPWDAETCSNAAKAGHLHILQWARNNDCPWNSSVYVEAGENHHYEILEWSLMNGCPLKEHVCASAARDGNIQFLQWLRTNHCPWDTTTCSEAAEYGHLKVLKWARQQGCPWNEDVCSNAAMGGHLKVLKWARANGCPWDEDTYYNAQRYHHHHILRWADANNCPRSDSDYESDDVWTARVYNKIIYIGVTRQDRNVY